MALTRTTTFTKVEIFANSDVKVYYTDTIDDPDDAELPIQAERVVCLVPGDNITGLSQQLQDTLNGFWN